jgi:hypothetical protein
MSTRRTSLGLRTTTSCALPISPLSLVPRELPALVHEDVDDDSRLSLNESVVIAGIVPVPSSIPARVRDGIERMILLRFNEDVEALDHWLREDSAELQDASPFEALIAAKGLEVLRVLIGCCDQSSAGHADDLPPRMLGSPLRIVR